LTYKWRHQTNTREEGLFVFSVSETFDYDGSNGGQHQSSKDPKKGLKEK